VTGFLDSWAVVSAAGLGATTWLDADVSWTGASGAASGVRPLTVSCPEGEGQVVFSSFHTEEHPSTIARPQEWALGYVLLELM
jgi:hypothetical protein